MPAAYAHHRFGETCLELMPERVREICMKHREVYDFGVHGPDLLFYYQPLKSNLVSLYGSNLHTWSGAEFFELGKKVFQIEKENVSFSDKNAMVVYLLGFLAHFTLDSSCHGYINEKAETTEFSHNLIESQYEAYLMKKDKKNPLDIDRSKTLHPSKHRAEIIAHFFPFEDEKILQAMKGQKNILHLFYSPKQVKKGMIRKAIGMMRMKGDFGDLFLDDVCISECEEMNEEIYARYQNAEKIYPKLMENLLQYLYDREELDVYFNHDFEGMVKETSK